MFAQPLPGCMNIGAGEIASTHRHSSCIRHHLIEVTNGLLADIAPGFPRCFFHHRHRLNRRWRRLV